MTSSNYGVMFNNINNYSMEHDNFVICVGPYMINVSDSTLFIDSSIVKIRDLNHLVKDFGYSYQFGNSFPIFIVFSDGKVINVTDDYSVLEVNK